MTPSDSTSWEPAGEWYHGLVGSEGHYYHRHIIFPELLKLLKTKKENLSLLDMACGQGAFAKALPKNFHYEGVDISPTLIRQAKQQCPDKIFHLHDICIPFDLGKTFTHATMILAFQNLDNPLEALRNIKHHLKQGGTLVLVLNHPCFRIPRQSSWGLDEHKKNHYRRIDIYMSRLKIPLDVHPGNKNSAHTLSFHYPLSDIFSFLQQAGFAVHHLLEWVSDKVSTGKHAKIENRARLEFPLFLTLLAKSL
ncbi:MAG: class I SAM-dependent methyltransferase [Chlamydiae bacterium]|nr:class I SAM-dependent methyltransferase [Chlamydiota bacterium]